MGVLAFHVLPGEVLKGTLVEPDNPFLACPVVQVGVAGILAVLGIPAHTPVLSIDNLELLGNLVLQV